MFQIYLNFLIQCGNWCEHSKQSTENKGQRKIIIKPQFNLSKLNRRSLTIDKQLDFARISDGSFRDFNHKILAGERIRVGLTVDEGRNGIALLYSFGLKTKNWNLNFNNWNLKKNFWYLTRTKTLLVTPSCASSERALTVTGTSPKVFIRRGK